MLLESVVLLAATRYASSAKQYGPYRHVPVVRLRRAVESWIKDARRGILPEYRLREWRVVAARADGGASAAGASAAAAIALLEELCQLFFTSFETTVTLLFGAPQAVERRKRWFPMMRRVAKELGCWRGLPPSIAQTRVGMAALCRIAAAEWVARSWITGQDDALVDYPVQLFIDTHLDLLSAAVRYAVADDAWWFTTPSDELHDCRLLSVYPLPHRVVCVEELPDLVPYLVRADLLHDYGRNKKQATLGKALTHLFLCKMMNQICHIRHLGKKTEDYITAHPTVIGPLVRLVLQVGLLGNLPKQQSRLKLAARVRVNLDFVSDPFGATPTQPALTLERMIRWIYQHAHTALFLMRSYCIYTCEQDVAIDRMLGGPYKWADFKRIVCRATALVREQLSEQMMRNFAGFINWAPIEIGELRLKREGWSSTDITQLRLDRINYMHQAVLSASRKVLKGRVETMLPRKMTPTRRDVLGAHLHRLIVDDPHGLGRAYRELMRNVKNDGRSVYDDYPVFLRRNYSLLVQTAVKRPPGHTLREVFVEYLVDAVVIPSLKPQLDAAAAPLYVASWAAAQATLEPNASARDQQVMPLRFLEFLPLSREHIQRIRAWVYEYYVLDHSDNGYQRYATLLGQESLLSHILVHLFFRWVHWHRRSPPILLPIEHSQRQLQALRDKNGILPYQTTPEHLGRGLFCPCCGRWSTPVVDAPPWIVSYTDWMGSKQDWEEDARTRELRQRHEDAAAASNGKKRKKKRRRRRFVAMNTANTTTLVPDLHLSPLARQIARLPAPAASPNNFAIDVRTGDPYCMRGKRCGKDPVLSALRNGDFYAHDVLERMRLATRANEELLHRKRQARFGMSVTGADAARMPTILEEEEEEDAAQSDDGAAQSSGEEGDAVLSEDETVEREVAISDALVQAIEAGAAVTSALLKRLPAAAAAPAPRKKKTVWSTKLTERTFQRLTERLRQHAHAGPELATTCWAEPLYCVDLVGLWWRHRGKTLVGLCCYCGVITMVRDAAMTRKGLSCMHHAEHADEWPVDSPQSMAFRAPPARGDADAAESLLEQVRRRELYKNPWRLRTPVPCAYCRQQAATTVVFAFDLHFRVYEIPLCILELGRLRVHFPGLQLARGGSNGIEMLPLHLLWSELESSHAAALKRKDAQAARAAAASALRSGDVFANDLALPLREDGGFSDADDLFLELEEAPLPAQLPTGTIFEQIRAHPSLAMLIGSDPNAAIDFRFNLERPELYIREAAAQRLRDKLRDVYGI